MDGTMQIVIKRERAKGQTSTCKSETSERKNNYLIHRYDLRLISHIKKITSAFDFCQKIVLVKTKKNEKSTEK